MLTLQNNNPRWILSTIVQSGNRQFWGWLELARDVLCDIFLVSFFLCTWNQTFFSAFAQENSPVQPLLGITRAELGEKVIQDGWGGQPDNF